MTQERIDRLAQQIRDQRARETERAKERQAERLRESGPWWKNPVGFDPYMTTNYSNVAGDNPGYLPKTPMRMGSLGFYIHCHACNTEFESKGLKFCPKCLTLPAEERHAMRPAFSGRMCQARDCENPIPRTARAGTLYCSPACRKRGSRSSNVTDNPGEP